MGTKLEAVNDVMRRVGKLPVTALDTGGNSAQALAELSLDDAGDRIQAQGWHWNTKKDVELTPDGSDQVDVSALESGATLYHIDTYGASNHIDVKRVGDLLYDLGENQDTFPDVTELHITYVYEVIWADIPETFVSWITAEAAREFRRRLAGNSWGQNRQEQASADRLMDEEVGRAMAAATRDEIRSADVNVLETSGAKQLLGRPRMRNRSTH